MRRALQDGFTLLELVAVLAIFSMIAVMSVQALQATLRTQTRLVAVEAGTAALALGLARLRHDLEAATPLDFVSPQGARLPPLAVEPGGFGLSLAGQPRFDEEPTAGLARVEWRLADGVLSRRLWTTLIPARAASLPPAVPVLSGVTAMTVTPLRPVPAAAGDPAVLPAGVTVTLQTERWGPLTVTQAF